MEINEQTDLTTLAGIVKEKVNGLIKVYSRLILQTFLLFLAVTFIVVVILLLLFTSVDSLNGRVAVFGLIVIGAAGYALWAVLKPLFKIFKNPKSKGKEIFRKDHPELFALIDEVVAKVDCLQPKHVRVSDECNAYVYYSTMLGYMKTGRQNLTIGLPIVYGMSKTELKSILSHEFGHFTQKSVQINSTANLSEFICGSIARSIDEAEQSDETSVKLARGYIRYAAKIMTDQYHKIAPYNGILSRAQEFDADHYSQQVAGTDASVSALCKLDRISDRWNEFLSMLYYYQVNQKRSPEAVLPAYETFFKAMDKRTHETITPESHLSEPLSRIKSRITSADMADTHPSKDERVKAIRSYPAIDTDWDDSPAIEYFRDDLVEDIFNGVPWEIKQEIDPGATVFDRKKDITPEEIDTMLGNSTPPHLNLFGKFRLFLMPEEYGTGEPEAEESGTDESLFSEENAMILEEFYTAEDDMATLESVAEEHSPETRLCYLGKVYDGTNVPVEEHKAYFEPLKEKAAAIARRCNRWLDDKARELGEEALPRSYRIAALTEMSLSQLKEEARDVYTIDQRHDNTDGARNYVANFEKEFKERAESLMRSENGKSVFDYISGQVGLEADAVALVKTYFAGSKTSIHDIFQAYLTVASTADSFADMAWEKIKRELILGQKPSTEKEGQ